MSSASHPAITWGSRRGDVAPSTTPVVARSTSDALLAVTSSSGPTTTQPMKPEYEDLLDSIASSLASIAEELQRLADEGIDADCYSHPVKIKTV